LIPITNEITRGKLRGDRGVRKCEGGEGLT
jgi:hypothetical protein